MENLPNYKTRLYAVWLSMKQRCENPNSTQYRNYGARGIRVCDEWHSFENFKKWAYENGYDDLAPRGQCTIDRINVYGNYEPSNCRWANAKQQSNNKTVNRFIVINGISHTISEWCDIYNISKKLVYSRVKLCGWSYEEAIITPLKEAGWQHNENVRKKIRKRFLTCGGETKSLSEWSRHTGISESTLSVRIDKYGWSEEKALTTPIRRKREYGT